MLRKRLYDLLCKCISVKGLFFLVVLTLVWFNGLDPLYAFVAGSVWVGSREAFKHLIEARKNQG